MGRLALLAFFVIGLATAAAAPADDVLRAETYDWILTAPAALVTQPISHWSRAGPSFAPTRSSG